MIIDSASTEGGVGQVVMHSRALSGELPASGFSAGRILRSGDFPGTVSLCTQPGGYSDPVAGLESAVRLLPQVVGKEMNILNS